MLSAKSQKSSNKLHKDHKMSDYSDDERLLNLNEPEKEEILKGSKKLSTGKTTASHTNLLKLYLQKKRKLILEESLDADLPNILADFYFSIRTKYQKETYSVQSQKCIRASLN